MIRRIAAMLLGLALSWAAAAQELVPAAYTPAPTGVNLVSLAAGYSSGAVAFDPSLPVEDVKAGISVGSLTLGRTFGLLGRSANVTVIMPFVQGSLKGLYLGEYTEVDRSGLGDAVLRFAVNLYGAPAMDPAAFASYRARTLVGASLMVRAPTGQYDSSKVINIGANRWAFKPQVGIARVVGRWAFDAYLGGWFFTDNTEFLGGATRSQRPILSTEAHARFRVNPALWCALDVNYWRGGQTDIDGAVADDLQANSRVGLTLAWQVAPRHGLRLAVSRGAFTRIGGDFDTIGVSYTYAWMARRKGG